MKKAGVKAERQRRRDEGEEVDSDYEDYLEQAQVKLKRRPTSADALQRAMANSDATHMREGYCISFNSNVL